MLDGRRFACVPAAWINELGLERLGEVDPYKLADMVASRQFEGAYALALDMLADAMHTRRQILEKLARCGCCALTLEMVAARLAENGLIDDAAYAGRRAELSNRKGKGRRAALNDLISKGVAADAARAALENWDEAQEIKAAQAIALKYLGRRWADDHRHAQTLTYAALARRGYASDIARNAVKRAADILSAAEQNNE